MTSNQRRPRARLTPESNRSITPLVDFACRRTSFTRFSSTGEVWITRQQAITGSFLAGRVAVIVRNPDTCGGVLRIQPYVDGAAVGRHSGNCRRCAIVEGAGDVVRSRPRRTHPQPILA